MRESVGSTWIFTLIITFTLIFAGFLVLAMNYSKTYKIKNEMTSMLEKYEGLTYTGDIKNAGSIDIINSYLKNSNYNTKGTCSDTAYCVKNFDQKPAKTVTSDKNNCLYCIELNDKLSNKKNSECVYKMTVFFDFNLPVLGELAKFKITGETNKISNCINKI